ncbi:MAG: hypothetical protein QW728_01020 [Thermoplasmata archaeon]
MTSVANEKAVPNINLKNKKAEIVYDKVRVFQKLNSTELQIDRNLTIVVKQLKVVSNRDSYILQFDGQNQNFYYGTLVYPEGSKVFFSTTKKLMQGKDRLLECSVETSIANFDRTEDNSSGVIPAGNLSLCIKIELGRQIQNELIKYIILWFEIYHKDYEFTDNNGKKPCDKEEVLVPENDKVTLNVKYFDQFSERNNHLTERSDFFVFLTKGMITYNSTPEVQTRSIKINYTWQDTSNATNTSYGKDRKDDDKDDDKDEEEFSLNDSKRLTVFGKMEVPSLGAGNISQIHLATLISPAEALPLEIVPEDNIPTATYLFSIISGAMCGILVIALGIAAIKHTMPKEDSPTFFINNRYFK